MHAKNKKSATPSNQTAVRRFNEITGVDADAETWPEHMPAWAAMISSKMLRVMDLHGNVEGFRRINAALDRIVSAGVQ